MCWYCIRLDIYSILVLAYCFANKSFTEHHRTLSKWWATEETPTLEALDCSFPCFLCYTLVCKPWRFHFLHGWSLIYGIFFVNTSQKEKHFVRSAFLFGNDVCLRQMMLALPMMTAAPNDVCLTAHWGKHRIIAARSGATSFLRSKCIISPQAMHHLKYIRLDLSLKVWYNKLYDK